MRTARLLAIILLFTVGINAVIAGYLFIIDPSGGKLKIPMSVLEHSPFNNFLIPGILLFVINGLMYIVTAFLTIFKVKIYPEMILLQALLLLGWIIIQMLMLRTVSFLHYTFVATGLLLLALGFYLKVKEEKYFF